MNMENSHLPEGYTLATNEPEGDDKIQRLHKMMLGRYRYAITLGLLGAIVLGVAGWFAITPMYQDEALLRIPEYVEGDRVLGLEEHIQSQLSIIRGSQFLRQVTEAQAWQDTGREYSFADFAGRLETEYRPRSGSSDSFRIRFTDDDATVATLGLEAIVGTYEKHYEQMTNEKHAARLRDNQERLADVEKQIANINSNIQSRTNNQGIEALRAEYTEAFTEQGELNRELELVNLKLNYLKGAGGDDPGHIDQNPEFLNERIAQVDLRMRTLLNQRDMLKLQLDDAELNYGPNHPTVRRLRGNLKNIEKEIEKRRVEFDPERLPPELDNIALGNPDALRGEKQILEQKLKRVNARVQDLSASVAEVAGLQYDLESARNDRERIKASIEEILQERGVSRLEVVSRGSIPDEPYNAGKRKQVAALGGIMGGMLGFGVIVLLCATDQRLRDSDDAKTSTGELLGVLPSLPEDLADPDQAAIAAHCVHHIRTLLQVGGQEHHRVLSVTSPAAGTGKTSLTLAMGLSFAESGDKTLLIDCDLFGGQLSARINAIVRKRIGKILRERSQIAEDQIAEALKLSKRKGIKIGEALVELGIATTENVDEALHLQGKSRVGILDVIGGEPITSCVSPAAMNANLSILPVGNAQPHDAGKLSPHAIRRLLTEARKHYDTVLIDTGPVPASLEASVVAVESDGVVLTVSRGEQRPLAVKARNHLESIGARVAGVVFNRAKTTDVDPYSYRPRTISGDRTMAAAVPRHAKGRNDARVAGYGPIAKAVSLYGPEDEAEQQSPAPPPSNGNGNGSGFVAPSGNSNGSGQQKVYDDLDEQFADLTEDKGGFKLDDD